MRNSLCPSWTHFLQFWTETDTEGRAVAPPLKYTNPQFPVNTAREAWYWKRAFRKDAFRTVLQPCWIYPFSDKEALKERKFLDCKPDDLEVIDCGALWHSVLFNTPPEREDGMDLLTWDFDSDPVYQGCYYVEWLGCNVRDKWKLEQQRTFLTFTWTQGHP